MTVFVKRARVEDSVQDDEAKLQCTHPGCFERWSVNLGKPLCSLHQWGGRPETWSVKREQMLARVQELRRERPVPRANVEWALRIVARHELGEAIAGQTLKMAQEALA